MRPLPRLEGERKSCAIRSVCFRQSPKREIGDPGDRERAFLSELVQKLNELFGAEIRDKDKVIFAVHITEKLRSNDRVMAQVQNNPQEQALEADLPDAATEAIIDAMTSHGDMANRLLSEPEAMTTFVGLLYDLLRRQGVGGLINTGEAE